MDQESMTLLLSGALAEARRSRPADFYVPHPGQLAFHTAPHRIRALFPGNRYGKTTAIGVEVNCYIRPDPRWSPKPMDAPAQVLWFCKDLRQFEILKPRLERQCFDAGWSWNDQKHLYRWKHGAELWVVPGDRDWSYIQGINPDLICVDEECPYSLWAELQARGYGERDTKYILAATATGGAETWMKEQVYDPWLEYHAEKGMDEDRAITAQAHPRIWCLPKGGIADNPSMPKEKVESFRTEQWRGGQKEWAVRNFGGFTSWTSDPVFAPEDLAWLKEEQKRYAQQFGPGREGMLEIRVA